MNEITLAGMTLYQMLWYFLVYAFAGWVVEVAFQAVIRGEVQNRGFLNGPLCPIYGFGMLSVLFVVYWWFGTTDPAEINKGSLFLIGMVFTTLVELIGGFVLDKACHARWWDYSRMPLNFHGYICLCFSLIWGAAVVLAVDFIHPQVAMLTSWMPENVGEIVVVVLYVILFADVVVTILSVRHLENHFKQIAIMRTALRYSSDRLSASIAKPTIKATEKAKETAKETGEQLQEKSEQVAETIQAKQEAARESLQAAKALQEATMEAAKAKQEATLESLQSKQEAAKARLQAAREKILDGSSWGVRRLLNAFPDYQSYEYDEEVQEAKRIMKERSLKKMLQKKAGKASSKVTAGENSDSGEKTND